MFGSSSARAAEVQTDIGEVAYTLTPGMKCPLDFARLMESAVLALKDGNRHSYSRCADGQCERGYFDQRLDQGIRVFELTRNGEVVGHKMCGVIPGQSSDFFCLDYDTYEDTRYLNTPPVRTLHKDTCDQSLDYSSPMYLDASPESRVRAERVEQIASERVRRMREEAAR